MIDPAARIHATAELEDGVRIGPGTSVWHRAQIRSGARSDVTGSSVAMSSSTTDVILGDRVKVQNGALLYHGVTVEDGVFIGPGAILTNDRLPRALNAEGGLARADDWVVSPIHIASGASIGAGAIIVAGCDVGAFAMVGAGAVVTHEVPAHAVVAGNPARRIGWACVCGDRLHDSSGHPAPADRERYAMDQELLCPSCDRRYHYDADAAALARASGSARSPRSAGVIPVARPDIGPEEIAAVTAVLESGMLASGKRVVELEERWADVHRDEARDRGQQRHGRAHVHLRGSRPRTGRRGHHRRPHVQRDGQRRSSRPGRRRSSWTSNATRT